jgi:hypothetical protein
MAVASAQIQGHTIDRTFHFAHTESVQSMQEIATAIRTVGDIKDVSVDTAQKSFTVDGTMEQIGFADWLFTGLDRIVPVQPDSATREYRLSGGPDNIVRLYYVDHGQNVQEFQELATAVRTVGDIRRVYTYNAARAIIARGTADQLAMSDWVIAEIWKHGNTPGPHGMSSEYLLPADPSPRPNENVMRVFYVGNSGAIQDFQEFATLLRTVADVRRVYTYNAPRAMLVRGTAEQIALTIWLFDEIDQPATARQRLESAPYKYQLAGFPEDTIRVFYPIRARSDQEFQQIASQVRSATNARRAYAHSGRRALALRGNGEQIDAAERLLKQLDPADFASN